MFKQWLSVSVKFGLLFSTAIILVACGSSGGDKNDDIPILPDKKPNLEELPTNSSVRYDGETFANEDVQSFYQSFWINLESEARCGECHRENGVGNQFPFARNDNINLAYEVVNSGNPSHPDYSTYTCYVCNDKGHIARNCPKRKAGNYQRKNQSGKETWSRPMNGSPTP